MVNRKRYDLNKIRKKKEPPKPLNKKMVFERNNRSNNTYKNLTIRDIKVHLEKQNNALTPNQKISFLKVLHGLLSSAKLSKKERKSLEKFSEKVTSAKIYRY